MKWIVFIILSLSTTVTTATDHIFFEHVELIKEGKRCVALECSTHEITKLDEYILDWSEFVDDNFQQWLDKGNDKFVAIGGTYKDGGTILVEWMGKIGELSATEHEMIYELNKYRESRGLKDLVPDMSLMATAREQSRIMIHRGMNHGYTSGWSGENIAVGQRNPREVTQTWINSSGHRTNMIGNWSKVGVGGIQRSWTQQFK